jgi:hypothetical protein
MPGEPGYMTVVNVFNPPSDPRNEGVPQGVPGEYTAVVILARPGRPLTPEYEHSFSSGLKGDSHLAISRPAYSPPGNPGADQIRATGLLNGVVYEWTGLPNARGFLGKLLLRSFYAENLVDGGRKAYHAVASTLSGWSAHLDIPLHVSQIEVRETRTGNVQMTYRDPFNERALEVDANVVQTAEFRSAVSLYRDALESSSLIYRFLCLFKIIEGIGSLRVRRGRAASKVGAEIWRPREVVPSEPGDFGSWLNGIFGRRDRWDALTLDSIFRDGARGKAFTDLVRPPSKRQPGGVLRELRDDVAHALWVDTGAVNLTLSADDMLHREKVHSWLPVTRCIARYMLKHEFPGEFLRHLRDDGTFLDEGERTPRPRVDDGLTAVAEVLRRVADGES